MIRKQARQRRDYLYRKAIILREAEISEKRAKLRASLATGKPLDPSIANDQQLRKDYAYDESRPDRNANEELDLDDEYSQLSGIVDPRVLASFSLHNVVLRHDIPGSIRGTVSESYPHLIFDGFTTRLGERVVKILKHIFPPREPVTSKAKLGNRVVTFKRTGHDSIELSEVGPRMSMKLFEIRSGTLENKDGDVEWHLNQYTRTSRKKDYL
ncbi:hypothetical protein DL766_004106 [Monosporascus sp. MC13-8B]|uniref:U3 small nucleolar ribonucleoprotein protein IMP4 n=1 Tax=Monosporascus cannonballus TaxID=155416 RepID=A0ABY0HJR6_9PEZI|nr:hypothetical protein DL762_000799 [Monosporascus cannonballus]RYO96382.1 hypothetical protein DL763_003238 [Monosporascus cannonballus]RYP32099.1 hypothetical protein DL766_004106 [Monosporascus sp. MC13-8B]